MIRYYYNQFDIPAASCVINNGPINQLFIGKCFLNIRFNDFLSPSIIKCDVITILRCPSSSISIQINAINFKCILLCRHIVIKFVPLRIQVRCSNILQSRILTIKPSNTPYIIGRYVHYQRRKYLCNLISLSI